MTWRNSVTCNNNETRDIWFQASSIRQNDSLRQQTADQSEDVMAYYWSANFRCIYDQVTNATNLFWQQSGVIMLGLVIVWYLCYSSSQCYLFVWYLRRIMLRACTTNKFVLVNNISLLNYSYHDNVSTSIDILLLLWEWLINWQLTIASEMNFMMCCILFNCI